MTLLDQFGMAMKPGQGGGYRLVEDDGYGRRVYEDYDKRTGIFRCMIRERDGTINTKRWQNLDALGEYGKLVQEGFRPHSKKSMQQQCVIGMIDHYEIMQRCGWKPGTDMNDYDKKKYDQIINDSNEHVIKTRPGRISVQSQKWY